MLIRLNVGSIEAANDKHLAAEDGSWIERPVKMVYAGKFKSMDGDVEIKDTDIEKLVTNHNSMVARMSRMAGGAVPLTHQPPIQLDHSTSAVHTVGRLVGNLEVGEHMDDVGGSHKALFGRVRILGKENVEKIKDGRWATVSIGADLENHKVSELSITPFPAAAGATMLKRLHKDTKYMDHDIRVYPCEKDGEQGKWRWETKWHSGVCDSEAEALTAAKADIDEFHKNNPQLAAKKSQGEKRMSYKETKEKAALYEKCRKHLTEHQKLSEEDADKHLGEADDEKLKHLSEEHDKHLKHLAEEDEKKKQADEEKKKELTAHKPALVKLAATFKSAGAKVQLAEKASKIHVRLSKLRSDAKISPAELKGINIDDLAGKSEDVINATLSSYESRQPVIDTGLIGSTKAMTPAQLASSLKRMNMEKEELQTRLNMPSKRDGALARLKELDEDEKNLGKQDDHASHLAEGDEEKHLEAALSEHERLTKDGKHDEAKEHLRSYCKSLRAKHLAGGSAVPDPTPAMSALAAEVKSMHNEFVEYVKLTAPMFGATVEELI